MQYFFQPEVYQQIVDTLLVEKILHFWSRILLHFWLKHYYISGFYYDSGSKVTTFFGFTTSLVKSYYVSGFTTLLVIYYISGSSSIYSNYLCRSMCSVNHLYQHIRVKIVVCSAIIRFFADGVTYLVFCEDLCVSLSLLFS